MTDERTFPSAPVSIPQARRYTMNALTGVAPEVAEVATLLVSELATNSVRHAATEFTVSIDRDPDGIRIAVTDAGDAQPRLRSPGPLEHSGRGLQIVSALADDWGVTEMVDRPGKTVWFVVAVPPDRAHDGGDSGARRVAPATDRRTAP
jgi:Signal transduction histidine kinase